MDFGISEELASMLAGIRDFVETELYPLEGELLENGFRASIPKLHALRQRVKEEGWWLPHLAADHGGLGLSLAEFGMVSEVLGGSPVGHYVFNCQAPDAGNMEVLLEHATDHQREAFLEPLLAGEIRSCFGMTEPENAGSNPIFLSTRAVLDGDEWVLDGHKWFTSSADGASFCIVMAVTDPDAHKYQRASMIIVPTDTPGFELVRNIPVMGEAGEDYFSHAEIRLTDVRVPKENILGGEGAGFAVAQQRLGPGRIHHCMRWIGICERAFDMMCKRAVTRELSPGKPLGHKQFVQGWIAESRAEIDAARLMVLRVAWLIDQQGDYAARVDVSTIKFFVANVLQRVLDRAIQTHGALGITDDTVLSYWFRHERGARIYDGPDEVHKARLARKILEKYTD